MTVIVDCAAELEGRVSIAYHLGVACVRPGRMYRELEVSPEAAEQVCPAMRRCAKCWPAKED